MKTQIPKVLTIAGSDSGGCAGIQADLKTFAALGTFGSSVVTAVTAQNTRGVTAVENISLRVIEAQIHAVLSDIGAAAVKSGMIPTASAIRCVARCLQHYQVSRYVLDPVMVATSGARLMDPAAMGALCRHLLPLASVVTPNRYEAEMLSGRTVATIEQAKDAARAIHDLGAAAVLIKGGHLRGDATDLLYDGSIFRLFSGRRQRTIHLHGAGCTLAAAVAAYLAKGAALPEAVCQAKNYVTRAVAGSFAVGKGPGPLGHFCDWWG